MTRNIPNTAILYKEGLYVVETPVILNGVSIVKWELHSADGYHFYDLKQAENYDENGDLLPIENLHYTRYMIMRKDEQYVTDNIISVPIPTEENENVEEEI